MKYMLLVYGDESALSENEREDCYQESVQLVHEIRASGECLSAAPLNPTPTAKTVRIRDGKRLVTDGPFAETHEQLGGYYLLDVEGLDHALDIAARVPPARWGSIEVRQVNDLPGLPEDRA